jgi:hypothetical protein
VLWRGVGVELDADADESESPKDMYALLHRMMRVVKRARKMNVRTALSTFGRWDSIMDNCGATKITRAR